MSGAGAAGAGPAPGARLGAVDLLRGFVIALMSVDHASEAFNGGRLFTDSVFFWTPGRALPAVQFFTRWVTHLCAPTFVLLAGVALAISSEKRRARGESEASIGRHIAVRGLLLVLLEVFWMSPAMVGWGRVLFQVLYAIGGSLIAMSVLRRLSDRALLALGLGILVLDEAAVMLLRGVAHLDHSLPVALFVSGGFFFDRRFIIAYPLLPWLGMMCLGWVLGRRLLAWSSPPASAAEGARRAARVLTLWGLAGLAIFAVLRGLDGYGNMMLHREGEAVVQWLHVSKYPPSLTYAGLELGIAALILAALFRAPVGLAPRLTLFGRVSLFYYLLHVHLLKLVAWATGLEGKLGAASAWLGALAVLLVLYPACGWYARYKAAHPDGLARFV